MRADRLIPPLRPLLSMLAIVACSLAAAPVQADPVVLGEIRFKPGSDRLDHRQSALNDAARGRLQRALSLFGGRSDMRVVLEMAGAVVRAPNPDFAGRRHDAILPDARQSRSRDASSPVGISLNETLPANLVRILLVPDERSSELCPWHVVIGIPELFGDAQLRVAAGRDGRPFVLPVGSRVILDPGATGLPFIAAFYETGRGTLARLPGDTVSPPATLHLVHSTVALTASQVADDLSSRRADLFPSSAAPTQIICTVTLAVE